MKDEVGVVGIEEAGCCTAERQDAFDRNGFARYAI